MNRWMNMGRSWLLALALLGCGPGEGGEDGTMPGEEAPVASELSEQQEIRGTQAELLATAFGAFSAVPTGLTNEGPAVMSRGGNLDVYVRGLDQQVYYNYWSSLTGWLGWTAQGGIFTSKPSATSIAGNSGLATVGRGMDSAYYIKVSLPVGGRGHPVSTGWLRIPNRTFVEAPAIAFINNDTICVFGIGTDHGMYVARNRLTPASGGGWTYNHGSWSAWQALGGVFTSEPAATVTSSGRLYVAGRGTDRRFWYATSYSGTTYTGWNAVPNGVYSSGPALVAHHSEVNILGRGLDGAYWIATATSGNFGSLGRIGGGTFDSSPAAAALNGRVYVFGAGLDERIYYSRSP